MARSLPNPESSETRQRITELLRQKGNRLLSIGDICERLGNRELPGDEIARAVEDLENEGIILAVRGKRYSLLEFTAYHAGRIKVHPDGYGIVFSSGDDPDIYIDRRSMRGAMNGDLVIVRAETRGKRFRKVRGRELLEGEVTRVLRRAHKTVVGRYRDAEQPYVIPYDVRLDTDIYVDVAPQLKIRDGEMVDVEIERYPDRSSRAHGRVVEVLGMIGEPGVDVEVVIRKLGIPHEFPTGVLREAEAVPLEVPEGEIGRRKDLRDRTVVTIDGETAKDFDDAVDVVRLPNGNFRLGVHIADVSHYVREGTALDREAFERGTSVYFPGRAVPMLPERLSNGICSLNPRVDRLTFSADIEIDPRGRFIDRKVYKSVIRTRERMTYTEVNAILTERTPELMRRYAPLLEDFARVHELYEILRKRREGRGSIDFDLPEAHVMLGESGEIEAIHPSERNVAHRIIEEFMLAANEVVAQELVFANQPGIFRVHQQPDPQKLADLKEILKEFKLTLRGDLEDIRPGELQRVLNAVIDRPEERFLTELVLRSMKRAFYSEESIGHFALALQHYCHFTSPIRRYPDLVVHRMLSSLIEKGSMHGEELARCEAEMPVIAAQSSDRERRSDDAEREVLEWKKVIFMRDKVGQQFTGFVTGVLPFGLFVELDAIFVQGLVPIATVGGDFWNYSEREHRLRGEATGRELRLGDHVVVEVKSIDEDRHQIEFRLMEVAGAPIARRQEEKEGRRRR